MVVGILILASSMVAFCQNSDVEKHWAKNEINYIKEKKIVQGYTDGSFKPNNQITKAEFYKIINGLMGYSDTTNISFSDVNEKDWFYKEVAKGVNAGYILEKEGTKLNPNSYITREEVARIIGTSFGLDSSDEKIAEGFTDGQGISKEAKGYVSSLKKKKYIQGYEDGTFRPENTITRAEVVKMLYNISGQIVNTSGTINQNAANNVIVNTSNVVLKDIVINGDLYLVEGITEGNIVLDNVVVKGDIYVKGGGKKGIKIKDSKINNIIINKKSSDVKVVLEGKTEVKNIYAEEEANIVVNAGAKVGNLDIRIPKPSPKPTPIPVPKPIPAPTPSTGGKTDNPQVPQIPEPQVPEQPVEAKIVAKFEEQYVLNKFGFVNIKIENVKEAYKFDVQYKLAHGEEYATEKVSINESAGLIFYNASTEKYVTIRIYDRNDNIVKTFKNIELVKNTGNVEDDKQVVEAIFEEQTYLKNFGSVKLNIINVAGAYKFDVQYKLADNDVETTKKVLISESAGLIYYDKAKEKLVTIRIYDKNDNIIKTLNLELK